MSPTAERIIDVLSRARLPLEDEKQLQQEMALAFQVAGLAFVRERKITGGVIDFLVPTSRQRLPQYVGIEAKIKGGKRAIYRQIGAYCNEGRLVELIVATSLPFALPLEINGKPVTIVDLGRSWL